MCFAEAPAELAQAPSSLVREVPQLDDEEWKKIDDELRELQGLLHHLLATEEIPSDTAMDQYTTLLTTFLSSKPEFQGKKKAFLRPLITDHHPRGKKAEENLGQEGQGEGRHR